MAEIEIKELSIISARDVVKRSLKHENAILVIILIIVIGIGSAITKGFMVTLVNVRNVITYISSTGVAAIGQGFCMLTGNFDISVGGIALMTATFGTTLMTTNLQQNILGYPLTPSLAIPLMLLLGLGTGAFNGLLISRLGLPAFIATLAMWQITTSAAYRLSMGFPISGVPPILAVFGQGVFAGVPVPIIIFIAVAITAYLVLNFTTFGRSVYATGGNPTSAWLSGIQVPNIVFSVYLISGFLAALAGLIIVGRTLSASMSTAAGLEFASITAVVLGGVSIMGGRGNLIGMVVGVLIIGAISNILVLSGSDPHFQNLVKGVVLFGAVAADVMRRRRGTPA